MNMVIRRITADKRLRYASPLPAAGRQIAFLSACGHLPAPSGAPACALHADRRQAGAQAGGIFFYPQDVMIQKTYHCRVCMSTNIVRNGHNKCGQSQYHCKTCGVY